MVFRDNIVYKNDNTISKNHLIFISNIPFDTILYNIKSQGKSVIDERKCVCYYKNSGKF